MASPTKTETTNGPKPMTHFSGEETEKMAKRIHYPECWDMAAYPTLADAIYEIVLNVGCSEHRMPEVKNFGPARIG
jgi:hypothetical protein